jgi:integrase
VQVRPSSDAQLGDAANTDVPRTQSPALCPVRALQCWVACLDGPGPLFRLVYGSRVSQDRLAPRAVSRAVQRAAERAALWGEYSAHSLRSGLAASAHAQGRSPRDIQAHGRWKDSRSLNRYIDGAAAARTAAAGRL